jgi:hypothetical protein
MATSPTPAGAWCTHPHSHYQAPFDQVNNEGLQTLFLKVMHSALKDIYGNHSDFAFHDFLDRFRDAPFTCKEFQEKRCRWGTLHPKERSKSWAEFLSASKHLFCSVSESNPKTCASLPPCSYLLTDTNVRHLPFFITCSRGCFLQSTSVEAAPCLI